MERYAFFTKRMVKKMDAKDKECIYQTIIGAQGYSCSRNRLMLRKRVCSPHIMLCFKEDVSNFRNMTETKTTF